MIKNQLERGGTTQMENGKRSLQRMDELLTEKNYSTIGYSIQSGKGKDVLQWWISR